MNLSEEQIERYSRQIVLKEVGGLGQEKLLDSKVSLIGLGALGSPVAYYLTAAGVGNIQLIDFDMVELSNLHRQIIHFTNDIDVAKTTSAKKKLKQLNPDCNIEILNEKITPSNVLLHLEDSDFVIEGSDNIETKMIINDACIQLRKPFSIAGVLRFHGNVMTVVPEKKTTCFRCIFGDGEEQPPGMSCSEAGVMGMIPGVMGCLEANEAIKSLLDAGDLLVNQILYVDLLRNSFDSIKVFRDENCKACGDDPLNLIETYTYGSDYTCH